MRPTVSNDQIGTTMTVHFQDDQITVHHGDCLNVLREMPNASVDSICTDPPYELSFMSKSWDASGIAYSVDLWRECLRVLKPGGHLLAFGGTRTVHRMTCAIEDAGFEIRDGIDWIYAQGFPKSLNVSEAVDRHRASRESRAVDDIRAWLNARRIEAGLSLKDVNEALGAASNGGGLASSWMTNPTSKGMPDWGQWESLKALLRFGDEMDGEVRRLHDIATGADRPVVDTREDQGRRLVSILHSPASGRYNVTGAATEQAQQWQDWGTALKPSREPIVLARKSLQGTVATNVLTCGTGALNIGACRVTANGRPLREVAGVGTNPRDAAYRLDSTSRAMGTTDLGRWPTNVVLSHPGDDEGGDLCADGCVPGCPVAELDEQSGVTASRAYGPRTGKAGNGWRTTATGAEYNDAGGASRFFPTFRYEAKAPTSERPKVDGTAHSTVKPLALMQWLVRLVTPPNGVVLDPFAGSGTTAEACVMEGFRCITIEREAEYLPLIMARLSKPIQVSLFADWEDAP